MIFEPLETGNSLFGIITFVALVCLALGVWGLKSKQQIIMMLGFFGTVILGGNAFFSYISQPKPVKITDESLSYSKFSETVYPFKEIRSATIESNIKVSNNSDESFEQVLLIELTKQRTILLAESQYPIREIKATLDEKMAAFNNQ